MPPTKTIKPALKKVFSEAQQTFYDQIASSALPADKEGSVKKKTDKHAQPRQKQGFARLMELASGRSTLLVLASLFAVFSALMRLVPFGTVYLAIRELIFNWNSLATIDMEFMWTLAWITFGGAILYGICSYTSTMLAHRAAFDILYEIRLTLMDKLARIPSGFFSTSRQGEIKKILNEDVEKVEGFIAHNLSDMVTAICTPLLMIVGLLFIDWRFALLLIVPVVIAFFFLGQALGTPEGAACQKSMAQSQEKLEGTTVEFVHGMPVVKVFNRSLSAFSRFEQDAREFVGNIKWATYFNASGMGKLYAAIGTQMLFLLPAAIFLIPTAPNYPEFLSVVLLFFLAGSGMKEPVLQMLTKALSINSINASVERIDQILDEPETTQPEHTQSPDSFNIELSHISFSYDGSTQALDDISISIDQGSILGLVGPSGGGKSTIASLILRFFDPQSGYIKIGGIDLKEIAPNDLTRLVSSVFQDSFIFADTIESNIRMGSTVSSSKVIEAARAAYIHDFIETLPQGYRTLVGPEGVRLSGGEAQRIAIARALLRDTPIIILDEATAYADAENEAKIQEAFKTLARDKTVIIIAHRMKTIENADCILVVDEGKLIGKGTHQELLENCSLYKDMVDSNERRDNWRLSTKAEA